MKTKLFYAGALALCVIALGACAAPAPMPTPTAIPPTSTSVPPIPESHGIEIGVKAPDFSLTDATGKTVNLAEEVSKHKSVVLVFYRGEW